MQIKVALKNGAIKPHKAHEHDAGFDLCAMDSVFIPGGGHAIIDTGVHIAIPEGCRGSIVGRSGLNFKHDIICPTGTIDCGYTGAIMIKLYNIGYMGYMINEGDRVAQLIISPISDVQFEIVEDLEDSVRGSGGFGSTGK